MSENTKASYSGPYANPPPGSRGHRPWYRRLCSRGLAQTQQPCVQQVPSTTPNSKRTSLHQEVDLKATPQRIYQTLLSSKDFAAFTGAPAEIDPKPGGAFSLFGGQWSDETSNWFPTSASYKPGASSPTSPTASTPWSSSNSNPETPQTSVILDQTGFAEGDFDHLSVGWHSHYWEPLKIFLAKP